MVATLAPPSAGKTVGSPYLHLHAGVACEDCRVANPRETPPDASAAAEPAEPSGAEASVDGQAPAGPGERGRSPSDAIAPAHVRAPTRGNRRLEALLAAINGDEEVRTWWHMAQVQSERLGMSDH